MSLLKYIDVSKPSQLLEIIQAIQSVTGQKEVPDPGRRMFFRFQYRIPLIIELEDACLSIKFVDAYTDNFSGGGLGFSSRHEFVAGQTLLLHIEINYRHYSIPATVIHCEQTTKAYFTGVEFDGKEKKISEDLEACDQNA